MILGQDGWLGLSLVDLLPSPPSFSTGQCRRRYSLARFSLSHVNCIFNLQVNDWQGNITPTPTHHLQQQQDRSHSSILLPLLTTTTSVHMFFCIGISFQGWLIIYILMRDYYYKTMSQINALLFDWIQVLLKRLVWLVIKNIKSAILTSNEMTATAI